MSWLIRMFLPVALILFVVGVGLSLLEAYATALWVAGATFLLGVGIVLVAHANPRWQRSEAFDALGVVVVGGYLIAAAIGEAAAVGLVLLLRWTF